ncbi:MAG: VWA domain-containing protein [Treponemataceae bacterium]
MIKFENYYAFFLFFLIPLFITLYKTNVVKKISFPLNVSNWQEKTFHFNSKKIKIFKGISWTLIFLAYIFSVIALSDPKITNTEKRYISRGTEIMFVVDISPSMAALDFVSENRLETAKKAIGEIADKIPEISLGIVAMASEAECVMPPSMDRKTFYKKLNSLTLGTLGDKTAIGVGISSGIFHLVSSMANQKIIILITDGENNAGTIHPNTAARLAGEQNIPVFILEIGTRGTVPVEFTDPMTGKHRSGFIESSFDPDALKNIADLTGGSYFEIQSLTDLTNVLRSIIQRESVTTHFYTVPVDKEYYTFFIYIASIFIFLAWLINRIYLKEIL